MFEFIILVAIAGGIWYYFNNQKDSADSADSDSVSAEKVEAEVTVPENEEEEVAQEVEEIQVEASVVEEELVVKETSVAKQIIEPVKSKFVAGMPEDSSLRRHYQQLVAVNQAASSRIPEEAVLRRHFVQNLISEEEGLLVGAPSDSTLLRHYEALVTDTVITRLASLK